jgi:hypothetical protein
VAVSSVLFTIALLIPMPTMLGWVSILKETIPESGYLWTTWNYFAAAFGFASLANIVTGLIVIWTGYIKGARWAWFVMSVIVWVWFFPVFVVPYLPYLSQVQVAQWLRSAIRERGVTRDLLECFLSISLMVFALVLPVKTFFLGRTAVHASNAGAVLN